METDTRFNVAEILLVEDNPVDAMMMQEAFKQAAIPAALHVVTEGMQALTYLRTNGRNGDSKPDLILLDLDLPDRNGKEILAEIKGDPTLRSIPVAIVSGSDNEDDVTSSYELQANCYIVKPQELRDLVHVLKSIDCLWLSGGKPATSFGS